MLRRCALTKTVNLQWLAAAMPPEVWHRWAPPLQWRTSLPGVQAWWRARPTPFSAKFTAFVDSMLAAGPPDPAAAERRLAYLRGNTTDAPARRSTGGIEPT